MSRAGRPGSGVITLDPGGERYPPWGWRECLIGVGVAIACLVLLFGLIALVVGTSGDKSLHSVRNLTISLIATLGLELCLLGIAVQMTAGRYPGGLRLLGWRPRRVSAWLGWSLLAVVLAWITIGVYAVTVRAIGLGSFSPKSNVPEGIFEHRQTVALAVFLSVVVAPIAEETFFRGFIFSGLRRGLGFASAASVSGVLFALAHFQGTLIVPFTVVGVIFAFTYRRTGTLWSNVVAHITFNLVSVIGVLLAGGKS